MAKFVCPYCFQEYALKKVLYVCSSGHKHTAGTFEFEPVKCKKARCGNSPLRRMCPNCGQEIPKVALETPNLPFSIVGVPGSGKTNYITVMLHELSRISGLRLTLAAQNENTRDHQTENYKRIYEEHKVLGSTPAGNIQPQLWSIKNSRRKRSNSVPTYTFTIFDGAGEDHEKLLDTSSAVCRYIQASKAIILTLDPLTLPNIRKGGIVDELIMRNSLAGQKGEVKDAVHIVTSMADNIKRITPSIGVNELLNIPVAVVLTKFDTVIFHRSFGPSALIKSSSLNVSNGKVNLTELQQVDQEIRHWLEEIREGSFIAALESSFKEFLFFGVSSYGTPPKDAYTLAGNVRPHRVLDPIFWLFKKAKFVD